MGISQPNSPLLQKQLSRAIFAKRAAGEKGPWRTDELVPGAMTTQQANVARSEEKSVSADGAPLIYSCGLFDICAENVLMGLAFGPGNSPLIEWLTWQTSSIYKRKSYYITYVAGQGYADGKESAGAVADCCKPGESVEWGTCSYEIKGFGRLRRSSPTRCDDETTMRYCEAQPRYFINGQQIDDDDAYDKIVTMEVLYRDLACMLIDGVKDCTDGNDNAQFDGLDALIKPGYEDADGNPCTSMDSICIDWAGSNTNASAGATWNAGFETEETIPDGTSFISVVEWAFRCILDRIMDSTLANQQLDTNSGDIVIMGSTKCLRCLLDMFVCWQVCAGSQYNHVNLNSYEARRFRESLQKTGSLFGAGMITLCGYNIHLLPHNYCTENAENKDLCDIYMLTGMVGNTPVLFGELQDMNPVAAKRPDYYDSLDGGRVLTWACVDETCSRHSVQLKPRIVNKAPFLQAKFKNVPCTGIQKKPISELNPVPAACATVC